MYELTYVCVHTQRSLWFYSCISVADIMHALVFASRLCVDTFVVAACLHTTCIHFKCCINVPLCANI